jgi:hypothetical protein
MTTPPTTDLLAETRQRLAEAKLKLLRVVDEAVHTQRAEIYGLLAATAKKEAELVRLQRAVSDKKVKADQATMTEIRGLLESSREYYQQAFEDDRSQTWAIVQALVLAVVLRKGDTLGAEMLDDWTFAKVISERDRYGTGRKVIWAHSNLIELHLMALLGPNDSGFPDNDKARAATQHHADELVKRLRSDSSEMLSLRRQLIRYIDWWFAPPEERLNARFVREVAKEILDKLPESSRYPRPTIETREAVVAAAGPPQRSLRQAGEPKPLAGGAPPTFPQLHDVTGMAASRNVGYGSVRVELKGTNLDGIAKARLSRGQSIVEGAFDAGADSAERRFIIFDMQNKEAGSWKLQLIAADGREVSVPSEKSFELGE